MKTKRIKDPKKNIYSYGIISDYAKNIEIKEYLEKKKEEIKNESLYNKENKKNIVSVLYGGDGTLLQNIHNEYPKITKFFGVSGGTIGFNLNKLDLNELKEIIEENKQLVEVGVYPFEIEVGGKIYNAFFDIMLGYDLMGWMEFKNKDNESAIGDFLGSGMLITNSIGSTTGWNKSSGGVVLPLASKDWLITSIGSEKLVRTGLDSKKEEITIKINSRGRHPIYCYCDGRNNVIEIKEDEEIKIRRSKQKIKLLFVNEEEYRKKRRK
jgi:NAD kinase